MATLTTMDGKKALYSWDNLTDWKNVNQSLLKNLQNTAEELNAIFGEETVWNGVREYLFLGQFNNEEYNIKGIKDIQAFNAKSPKVAKQLIVSDLLLYFKTQLTRLVGVETEFVSEQVKQNFKNFVVQRLYDSLTTMVYMIRMYALATKKIPISVKTKVDGAGDKAVTTWKDTEDLDVDNTYDLKDWTDKDSIKAGLSKMREVLAKFKTPSLNHTKFSRNNKADLFYSSFMPSDFITLWATKYKNKINDLTANLFNKEDVLLKTKHIDRVFETTDKLTAAQKSEAEKIIAILIHKDAIKTLVPSAMQSGRLELPELKTLYEVVKLVGMGRLKPYPIVYFTNKG